MRIINFLFEIYFWLDMIVVFRTGIVHRREENDERYITFETSHVIKNYLGGWFCLDLVATIPWSDVYSVVYRSGCDLGFAPWQVRMLDLVRLIRSARFSRMSKTVSQWEDTVQVG